MPVVEVSAFIKGVDKRRVYAIIKDMERYPTFMPDLTSVTIVERAADTTVTRWVGNVDGLTLRWTERDHFDDANQRITYRQLDGDLKVFAGQWRVLDTEDGAQVRLTVEFEFGVTMLAPMIDPLLKRKIQANCQKMLQALEREAVGGSH